MRAPVITDTMRGRGLGWETWLNWIDARDCGADPRGVADSTLAIQQAVYVAQVENKPLYIPAGTYRVTSTIVISDDLQIEGDGSYCTIIDARDVTGVVLSKTIDALKSLQLKGFQIIVDDSVTYILSLYKCPQFLIDDLQIMGQIDSKPSIGIYLDAYCYSGRINNSVITYCDKGLMLGFAGGHHNFRLNATDIAGCTTCGIHLDSTSTGFRMTKGSLQSNGIGAIIDGGRGINFDSVYLESNLTADYHLKGTRETPQALYFSDIIAASRADGNPLMFDIDKCNGMTICEGKFYPIDVENSASVYGVMIIGGYEGVGFYLNDPGNKVTRLSAAPYRTSVDRFRYINNGLKVAGGLRSDGQLLVFDGNSLGIEKVGNPDFATVPDLSWTWGAGWSHDTVNFEADHATGNTAVLEQNVNVVLGEIYRVAYTIKNRTAGTVTCSLGGVSIYPDETDKSEVWIIKPTTTANLKFTPSSSFDGSIDDVSVKKITAGNIFTAGSCSAAGVPIYANNAAALAGGLVAGDFYRTNADPDTLCIVH